MLDRLERPDRRTELFPLTGVLDGRLQAAGGAAELFGRGQQRTLAPQPRPVGQHLTLVRGQVRHPPQGRTRVERPHRPGLVHQPSQRPAAHQPRPVPVQDQQRVGPLQVSHGPPRLRQRDHGLALGRPLHRARGELGGGQRPGQQRPPHLLEQEYGFG